MPSPQPRFANVSAGCRNSVIQRLNRPSSVVGRLDWISERRAVVVRTDRPRKPLPRGVLVVVVGVPAGIQQRVWRGFGRAPIGKEQVGRPDNVARYLPFERQSSIVDVPLTES